MNRKCFPITLTLACVLALGCVSCSQSPSSQQQEAPAPGATAPAVSQTAGEPGGMVTQPQPNGSAASSAAGDFDALAGSQGYVTYQGAQHDPWLASHFSECDTNHDGHVTRQEYDQCRQSTGRNAPPQPPQRSMQS